MTKKAGGKIMITVTVEVKGVEYRVKRTEGPDYKVTYVDGRDVPRIDDDESDDLWGEITSASDRQEALNNILNTSPAITLPKDVEEVYIELYTDYYIYKEDSVKFAAFISKSRVAEYTKTYVALLDGREGWNKEFAKKGMSANKWWSTYCTPKWVVLPMVEAALTRAKFMYDALSAVMSVDPDFSWWFTELYVSFIHDMEYMRIKSIDISE